MARSRYEFIKIEQRLFNDPDFYMLTEFEQLTYIKLVSMLKQTRNKIPKNLAAIQLYLRTNRSLTEVESAVNRIKGGFRNFKENKYFYYFEGFNKMYGYLGVEEEEDKEEDKDKDTHELIKTYCTLFKERYKKNPVMTAKDSGIAKRIAHLPLEAPLSFSILLQKFFDSKDKFIVQNKHSLNILESQINKLLVDKEDWRDG